MMRSGKGRKSYRRTRNIDKDVLMTNCNDAAFYKFALNEVFIEFASLYMS